MHRRAAFMPALFLAFAVFATACADTADDAGQMETGEAPADTAAGAAAPETTAAAAPAGDALLNPNEATRDELLTVPNVDAALADALVAGRPYADMLGVDRVLAGRLSEEQRDSAYTRLFLPLDLNTASAEEIMLIPGVGERMQHEFEEYRPYTNIAQFRREMAKYVDDAEVARLEKYVTIR